MNKIIGWLVFSGNIDDASEILGSGNSFIGINNVKNDGTEKFGNHIIPIQKMILMRMVILRFLHL